MTSDEPLSPTATRHATCGANAEPGGDELCGEPTTLLVFLTCDRRHARLVPCCDDHTRIALALREPGAITSCLLCEELTGVDEPMTISSVEPWDPHHPVFEDIERTRRELEAL